MEKSKMDHKIIASYLLEDEDLAKLDMSISDKDEDKKESKDKKEEKEEEFEVDAKAAGKAFDALLKVVGKLDEEQAEKFTGVIEKLRKALGKEEEEKEEKEEEEK